MMGIISFDAHLFGGPKDGAVLKVRAVDGKCPTKIDIGKRTDYDHVDEACICWQYYYYVRNINMNKAAYIWEGMGRTDAIIL